MNLKEELQNLQTKTHAWKRPIIKPAAISGFFLALLYSGQSKLVETVPLVTAAAMEHQGQKQLGKGRVHLA